MSNESATSRILRSIKLTGEPDPSARASDDEPMSTDPRYLRQSSALIHESLQNGLDVLQLANGDIVTTGTQIVVTQYTWDEEKGRLVKVRAGGRRGQRRSATASEDA